MVRSPGSLVSLALAGLLVGCGAPEPTPEVAPEVAPGPAPRSLPLALIDMLDLAGERGDFLVVRDGQALVDAGVPWQSLVQSRVDSTPLQFLGQLYKFTEGDDPPLRRAGIDLRGGLVFAEPAAGRGVFALATSDPSLTATLLTTLPYARSDQTVCKALAAAPPHAICSTHAEALAEHTIGGGAARLDALEAMLPGVDLEAASVLGSIDGLDAQFTAEIGVGQQVVHVHVGPKVLPAALDMALAPGPATLLRFVAPGVGFVWARADVAALRVIEPDLVDPEQPLGSLADAWTGELLVSGVVGPAGVQARAGLTSTSSAASLLKLLAIDAADAKPVAIDSLPGAKVRRDAGVVEVAGESTPQLRAWLEGAPQVAAIAQTLGLAPRLTAFTGHGSIALVVGVDEPQRLGPQADPEAALRGLPVAAVSDLKAGRVVLLAHLPLDVLASPQMHAALDAVDPFILGDRWEMNDSLRSLGLMSSATLWATELAGKLVWHLAFTTIGHTADARGQAGLAALAGTREEQAKAFDALASAHPDSPLVSAYRTRSGAAGTECMSGSLIGASVIVVKLLEKYLADEEEAALSGHEAPER